MCYLLYSSYFLFRTGVAQSPDLNHKNTFRNGASDSDRHGKRKYPVESELTNKNIDLYMTMSDNLGMPDYESTAVIPIRSKVSNQTKANTIKLSKMLKNDKHSNTLNDFDTCEINLRKTDVKQNSPFVNNETKQLEHVSVKQEEVQSISEGTHEIAEVCFANVELQENRLRRPSGFVVVPQTSTNDLKQW